MKIFRHLYVQVLAAIVLGVLLGWLNPGWGATMRPLGDGFIKLIKMLIAPIIFTTVVSGIAGMGDLKKIGRVGIKALLYFEVVSTLALVIGLVVVNWIQPGVGLNVDPATLDTKAIAQYTTAAHCRPRRWIFCCTSSPTPSWERSLRGRFCRCCSSRCSLASRSRGSGTTRDPSRTC